MRRDFLIVLALFLFFCGTGAADEPHTPTTAFIHANVLPMDTEDVLHNYTVIITDGRISAMGPAETTPIPPEAQMIDAEGAYLMPGMADMHAHLSAFDANKTYAVPGETVDAPGETVNFQVDREMIPNTVALLRNHQIDVVATLVVDEVMVRLCLDTPGVLAGREYRVIPPAMLEGWRTTGRNVRSFRGQGPYRRDVAQPFLLELTGALHASGVMITAGVDASVEGIIPGYHIHRELELLVESGMTPYEALSAGTRNAGQVVAHMGRDGNFGVIRVGNRADLVLLSKNPFESVSATRDRIGVMARGRWYLQQELNGMVDRWVETLEEK
ncbi:MAG: amidohydrolase family protein [Candidatus Latescibacteria bacterium]|nr:amidohydrolase family protein [Candidatus Latescibacterota bacterium]